MFSLYIGVDQGPSDPTANDLLVCHLFPSCRQFLDRPWTFKISDKISTKSSLKYNSNDVEDKINALNIKNPCWKNTKCFQSTNKMPKSRQTICGKQRIYQTIQQR